MEPDANLGALAESVSGSSSGSGDRLCVKVASRVGLGARVHRGREGYAGELGHVTAEQDGERC